LFGTGKFTLYAKTYGLIDSRGGIGRHNYGNNLMFFNFGRWQYRCMDVGDEEGNLPINKKLVRIPLSSFAGDSGTYLQGELTIPLASPKARALIIFAHGSGSSMDSPRNQYVAKVLNGNGFATLLSDLLTPVETESDIKSQKVMGKFPGIVLNKFNIHLLSERLYTITKWIIENESGVKGLPIGYFGSSTGAAAAIEAAVSIPLLDKVYAIVSRGGRPDLAYSENIKNLKAATMLMVGAKDSKDIIDLNKKAFKQLKNTKAKELIMVPNAGHLFEEEGTMQQVADVSTRWFTKFI
jgi:dienelactone hydrolase